MKRTTIVLADELAARLDREQRRQGSSASAVIREALEAYLASGRHSKRLSFANLGKTESGEAVGSNAEAILAADYANDIARRNGITLPTDPPDPQLAPRVAIAGRVSAEDDS